MSSAKTETKTKTATKSTRPSGTTSKKRGRPPKPKVDPTNLTKVVIMLITNMDDLTLVRTGGTILDDLGLNTPVESWTDGNFSEAAAHIRKELDLPELKNDYIYIANILQSKGFAHKLASNLADTIVRIGTLNAFCKTVK